MEVCPWLDKWGRRVSNHPQHWIRLGKFESLLLSGQLEEQPIVEPIFVTGLARSGSTIVLEILNQHPATKSFSYQDFPFVHIPWFWSKFLTFTPRSHQLVERAHKDRIMITPESPEAMEEMIWMHFFPRLHDENVSHLKNPHFDNEEFKRYYTSTIKKILLSYQAERYLSKGNYNVTRVGYILDMFPDARIIIPIRHPVSHIKSLIKQHELFVTAQKKDHKVLEHLQRVGHFEFGLGRKAVNTGHIEDSQKINRYWNEGDDITGYAMQWALVYDYVFSLLQDQKIKDHILVLKYEDLCRDSSVQLEQLFEHAQLSSADDIIKKSSSELSLPKYYQKDFSDQQLDTIHTYTHETATRFGYQ